LASPTSRAPALLETTVRLRMFAVWIAERSVSGTPQSPKPELRSVLPERMEVMAEAAVGWNSGLRVGVRLGLGEGAFLARGWVADNCERCVYGWKEWSVDGLSRGLCAWCGREVTGYFDSTGVGR
jgi:hypothetical protein